MSNPPLATLDASAFRDLVLAGAGCLEANADAINALNVFPVPDGDTGLNMTLTLRAALDATPPDASSVGEASAALARGALLGARGNSGVIFSQFLKGLAAALADNDVADGPAVAAALDAAADAGYEAVGNPVEGTMLSVMRAAGGAALASGANAGAAETLRDAGAAAERALARTPEQLPVLKEAGVVDAGGQGVVAFLAGMAARANGEDTDYRAALPDGAASSAASANVSREFLEHTEEEMYGYCTQFVVQGEGLDPAALRERVMAVAASTVVIGDDRVVRVHAHAEDPGPLLSIGAAAGALSRVDIVNMDAQHQDFMTRHGYEGAAVPHKHAKRERAVFAVVPVAPSEGLARIFRSLGAAAVVSGGQTMNPNAAAIIAAVEEANADLVVALPNNKNVILAAEQAAALSESSIAVAPSATIPQGVAAMLAVNPDLDAEANVAAMTAAMSGVRSGEVTTAVRSAVVDGVAVAEGQAIAMLDGALAAAAATPNDALAAMLDAAGAGDGALVTLYYGAGLAEPDAREAAVALAERFPGAEIEIYDGGQPHYHYLVSIE